MGSGETQQRLAAITDQGLFERLATAVLRQAEPLCRHLAHPGVNLAGKTVKSTVDGITFAQGANPSHMIAVHHTTCKRKDLKGKWLLDPAEVQPRGGGKPTAPAGDLIKTATLFAEQKCQIPNLEATLFLTTNKEPPDKLICDVHKAGHIAGLDVIIWPRSLIADFLDFEPKGQWIRNYFLGIDQERLSEELLHEISRRSLECSDLPDDSNLWIDRQFDQKLEKATGRDVVFIVGESGFGKSVACHKRLKAHVKAGGFGFVIPHRIIDGALSLDQAIEMTLQQLHPSLVSGEGSGARALVSEHTPLLMVVEDINKSGQPTSIVEKLVSWSTQKKELNQTANWQLFCPVWPRILLSLGDQLRKMINELVLPASSFTAEEATIAVQHRWEHAGVSISKLDAEAVTSVLGQDPLLIALQDPTKMPNPNNAVQSFIDGSLDRLAGVRGEFTAGEYRRGLRHLSTRMLELPCFDLSMTAVVSWFSDTQEVVKILRHIAHFGEIIRISGPSTDERLSFRHDRVRDWLLADAVADLMSREAIPDAMVKDPFFAEIFGTSLVRNNIPIVMVEKVRIANPLALFCAMRVFGEPTNDLHHAIIKAAIAWLDDEGTHGPQNNNLRWTALRILSETDGQYVTSLVESFLQEKDNWWGLRARFRNGDFVAGIKLCSEHRPGRRVVGHLELIDHVQRCWNKALVCQIDDLLRNDQLTPCDRSGTLRLAGYLGDPRLAGAIKTSWLADSGRDERLADYLWAGAQCCGDHPSRLLAPVCDTWAKLPDETEEGHSASPRDNLAAYTIRWAFRDKLPEPACRYFIERAQSSDLQWPITYMLHDIDHPDAVEFVARELAAKDEQLEGTESYSHFATTVSDAWHRFQEKTGCAMSNASRNRLYELWTNKGTGKYLRKQAFKIWCSTIENEDIPILQTLSTDKGLGDEALFQRLRRGDREAIAGLVEKLKNDNPGYWWQAGRYIWSDDLTESLDDALVRRGERVERKWEFNDLSWEDRILSERLMELPARTAEQLLIKHWDHLCYVPYFVQAAFYTTTPRLTELAEKAVAECPEPKSLFKFVTMNFGTRTTGRTGITRIEQIEVLLPYFDYLDVSDILSLWEVCNSQSWFQFRRKHFDARVKSSNANVYVDDNMALKDLDRFFNEGGRFWADLWTSRFRETGVSVDHMMETVQRWLKRHTDIRALRMAAEIVIQAGKRCHLIILHNHKIETADRADLIISNAEFALKRRSLN